MCTLEPLLTPVEIKSSHTFDKSFLKGIKYFRELAADRINRSYLIYSGDIKQTVSDVRLLNYRDITSIYEDLDLEDADLTS